jgi:hypothetical protein
MNIDELIEYYSKRRPELYEIIRVNTHWDEFDFKQATNRSPIEDDLERCNCPFAGKSGHLQCGVCVMHNKPIFMCSECMIELHKHVEYKPLTPQQFEHVIRDNNFRFN